MRTGDVDEPWAREHHEYWYNDVKSGKIRTEADPGVSGLREAQQLREERA